MIRKALILGLFMGSPLAAQEQASTGNGAVLRALDKVNGQTTDIELQTGASTVYGRLEVALLECRYPAGNPSGDAFAHLRVKERANEDVVYDGWMIASSPALNPMDHARYDVWVIRCKTS